MNGNNNSRVYHDYLNSFTLSIGTKGLRIHKHPDESWRFRFSSHGYKHFTCSFEKQNFLTFNISNLIQITSNKSQFFGRVIVERLAPETFAIVIQNVTVTDGGQYVCYIQDGAATIFNATLFVYGEIIILLNNDMHLKLVVICIIAIER